MKYLLFVFAFIFSFSLLYTAFFVGYKTATKEVLYVFKDAPVFTLSQEKYIGDVAGAVTDLPTLQTEEKIESGERSQFAVEVGETNQISENTSVFSVVNEYRVSHSIPALSLDERLCQWVNSRLDQLVSRGSLDSHEGFQSQIHDFLGNGYTKLAENIGQGFLSSSDLIHMWEESLSHKATMESQEYSVGCAESREGFGVLIVGS